MNSHRKKSAWTFAWPSPAPGQRFCLPGMRPERFQGPRHSGKDLDLDFFQHEARLSARMPRVRCEQCSVRLAAIPWVRPDRGFTLLFETQVISITRTLPVKTPAVGIGEQDTRIWQISHHYVDESRVRESYAGVFSFGVDETACKRGHKYVSVFMDMATRRVLFAPEGKDARRVETI